MYEYYGTLFPLWDESYSPIMYIIDLANSAAVVLPHPEIATNVVVAYMPGVYDRPSYGMVFTVEMRLPLVARVVGSICAPITPVM